MGGLEAVDAETLVRQFEFEYAGGPADSPRIAAVIALTPSVLERAARSAADHGLRAYDAIQLSSACSARDADARCSRFACFDNELRIAAARSGFSLVPAEP